MLLKELPKREKKGLSIRARREEENGIVIFFFGVLCGLVLFPMLWVAFFMAMG